MISKKLDKERTSLSNQHPCILGISYTIVFESQPIGFGTGRFLACFRHICSQQHLQKEIQPLSLIAATVLYGILTQDREIGH